MRTITLSEARDMASDPAYITTEDVGRMAILCSTDEGESLVDLAATGETADQAIAAYLRRVSEDDADGMSCAIITE